MRIKLFGAGMVGVYVGGMLAQVADVTLIGRSHVLDALDDGLRLTDVDGLDRAVSPAMLQRTARPESLSGADLVLVTVKSLATADAAAAIAAHAPPSAVVISLQNGVANAPLLRSALPGRTVLAGMVPFNITQRAPDHYHRGTGGALVVEDHPAVEPLQPLFAAAGLPLSITPDILGMQWGKLLINLNNAINALSGVPLMQQLMQRDFRRCWALALDEGLRLVKAAKLAPVDPIPMPLALLPQILRLPDPLYRFVAANAGGGRARVDPHARSSMADDLERGRPTEVDFLQGELVRLASRLGRAAPVNARIIDLIRAAEGGAKPWEAGALKAELQRARRA